MYENEKLRACEQVESKVENFINTIYGELMNFNLDEQNEILRYLHERTREERAQKISELKKQTEYFEASLKELN